MFAESLGCRFATLSDEVLPRHKPDVAELSEEPSPVTRRAVMARQQRGHQRAELSEEPSPVTRRAVMARQQRGHGRAGSGVAKEARPIYMENAVNAVVALRG